MNGQTHPEDGGHIEAHQSPEDTRDEQAHAVAWTGGPGAGDGDVGRKLHHLARLMRRTSAGRRGRGPHDETRGQGRVLALLRLHSPIAQRELSYLLGVRPQSLGELLAKLEGIGLVRRTSDPEDARARLVELTDAGRSAADELSGRPSVDPLAPLTAEERTQFVTLLDRIIAGLEETLGEDPDWDGRHVFGPDGRFGLDRGFDPRDDFRGCPHGAGGPAPRGGRRHRSGGGPFSGEVGSPDEARGRGRGRGYGGWCEDRFHCAVRRPPIR